MKGWWKKLLQLQGEFFETSWSENGRGYSFQTPESWDSDGNYRSLCYMRPLAIWAMQWALAPPKRIIEAPQPCMKSDGLYPRHIGYSKVAEALRLISSPKVKSSRGFLRYLFDCTCGRKRL